MSMLFDSHAHLTDDQLWPEIDAVMQRAGNMRIINICTDPKTLERGLELARRYPNVQNAGATTPHDVEKEGEECFAVFEEAAKAGKLVAVGETGLEYFYKELDRGVQKRFLERYVALAEECNLPLIFHCREAFDDLFAMTRGVKKAILHCFTGSVKEAEGVIERGWYLSLSGIVTFKKSESLREIAKMVPLKQLLIETDAPYLAPESRRGKRNEPAYIQETAKVIAAERGIEYDALVKATFDNAERLLLKNVL